MTMVMEFNPIPDPAAAGLRYADGDRDLALRLKAEYGYMLRWIQDWKSWMIYEGGVWRRENRMQSQKLALLVCTAQLIDNAEAGNITSMPFIKKVIDQAKAMLAVDPSVFDQLTGVLNFTNGLLDLGSGELLSHNSGHYLTKQIAYDWDPDAECDLWNDHLRVMCKGDSEYITMIQRLVGMSLWGGSERAQVFPHLMGKGRNGKGVFVRAIGKALGDYYINAPINLLTKREDSHPAEYMTLKGTRFVGCSEMGTKQLNLNALRLLTGGDDIMARDIGEKNQGAFPNTWIMWAATNYELNTTGDSADAFWERYIPIDLGDMIEESKRDPGIEKRLEMEIYNSALIAWAVRGCTFWRDGGGGEKGLCIPEKVKERRAQSKGDSDVFGTFMTECVEIGGEAGQSKTPLVDIAMAYQVWALSNGEKMPMSSKAIAGDLRSRFGVRVARGNRNKMTAFGLRLCPGCHGIGGL